MANFVELGLTACDALGVESAWMFLLFGIFLGPIFVLLNAAKEPSILLSLDKTRKAAFATLWKQMADPLDKRYAEYKAPFMKDISGVVLDMGSGLGHNLKYLDHNKVSRLLLVEPNPGMHDGLRANAIKAGFKEGQFQIVACGAQEKTKVEQLTGLGKESVDAVVSLLALCGIPDSRQVISACYDYLKPGGKFYFFEHVASHTPSTKKTQDFLNPSWKFLFGGCNINRPTDKWILESFEWSDTKSMTVGFEKQGALDPKVYGWAQKPAKR